MIIWLNGKFIPEESAMISIMDRGFLYGDGLFETLRICAGRLVYWDEHWKRLERALEHLQLRTPHGSSEMRRIAEELMKQNVLTEGLLRITLSRGKGPRGYSPKGAESPTVAMWLHPLPPLSIEPKAWTAIIAKKIRVPGGDPFAGYKTSNRLAYVMAKAEADEAGVDEAILTDEHGHLLESASGNLFVIKDGGLHTPALGGGLLPGITRQALLRLACAKGISCQEGRLTAKDFESCEGAFVTLSTIGIARIHSIDGRILPASPLVDRLQHSMVQDFCA